MLAIFDTEGVLVDAEFMPEVARLIGKEREVSDITEMGIRGEIDWEEGLFRRIEVLKGISYEDCLKVALEMPLMPGATETFRELKRMGFKTMTVSGGPSLLVERVKGELGIDYAFANELIFREGRLSGVDLRVTSDKSYVLRDTIKWLGEEMEDILSTVDGANDLNLFDIAGLRIAFNAQPVVEKRADEIVRRRNLLEIIPIIREHFFSPKKTVSTASPKSKAKI